MNLIELFGKLAIPERGNEKRFNAVTIPEYPKFRVAVDFEGNPVLLLSMPNAVNQLTLKNLRLQYLQLVLNADCKIIEDNETSLQSFTVITFTSSDLLLREYFLKVSETLVKSLSDKTTQQQIVETLTKFVEIFRPLSHAPTKTIQGLWTELFFINNCSDSKTVLNFWHNLPEQKFDFDSGLEKIEVKSNSNFTRTHYFSSEQLNAIEGIEVLIASIFASKSSSGQNIQHLVDSITTKLGEDFKLINKLNSLICKTLGNSFEESIKIKFDSLIARNSLRFYNYRDISKIDPSHIPSEVSEVKYKSDLSKIRYIDINRLKSKGILFTSI